MPVYEVTHRTEYRYPSPVSASFGELVILPRDRPDQRCLRSALTIEPRPNDVRERVDFFGNRAAYFAVLARHTELAVTATSLVQVRDPRPARSGKQLGWRVTRDLIRVASGSGPDADPESLEARQFVLSSPRVTLSEQLAEYAAPSFPPGASLLEAAVSLSSRIHRDFEYLPGVTEVTSTVDEVLRHRAGVCQDFAHVAIGCLRSLGLAARYVSGYLETRPPPGQERLAGVDASHAWFSVYLPGTGWVDVDPTNDQLVNDRYVTTAWGRDYTDVPPLKGVIFTRGDQQDLRVAVDVLRRDDLPDRWPDDHPEERDGDAARPAVPASGATASASAASGIKSG